MKYIIYLILIAILSGIVWGVDCEISTDNLTFVPIEVPLYEGCIDETNYLGTIENLDSETEYFIRCKDDTTSYGYLSLTTESGGGKTMGSSLAITLFILSIAGVLFVMPYKVRFSNNNFANLVARRSCFVIGFYLMTLNSAIMATIAVFADIPITHEMFMYMKLFGWAGYIAIITLVIKTLFDALKLWKIRKKARRTGYEE